MLPLSSLSRARRALQPWRAPRLTGYIAAVLFSIGAALLTHWLWPMPSADPLPLFWVAVTLGAWFGGYGPAVLTTVLTGITATALLIDPSLSPPCTANQAIFELIIFASVSVLLTWLSVSLRETTGRLRATLQASPLAVVCLDLRGRVKAWNGAAERILGWRGPDRLGEPFPDLPEEEREAYRSLQEKVLRGEMFTGLEIHHSLGGGNASISLDVSAAPITGPSGRITGMMLVAGDISELEQTEMALQRLADLVESKDQFIALISHELRNPLSPILAGVEVLRRLVPLQERAQRTLAIIERNAKLQARLVNDLLDLSRISRGKIQLQRVPVALDAVVRAAVQAQQCDAEAARVRVRMDGNESLWVLGDFDRLTQIVVNLLSNAVKFTLAGGEVKVTCRASEGQGQILVEDTGIGIDGTLMPHLFELFKQGDVAGQRQAGLGIGLALVKSLTELHGGRVEAQSDGPGKGSRFCVELPLTDRPLEHGRERSWEGRSGQIQVLLVEDSTDTRTLLAESLEMMGYKVREASCAEEGLELLRRHCLPDIILADIGLPGMNGYEFLKSARTLPGMGSVPAFAITGLVQAESVRQAREAGFEGHFVKPVDVATLDIRIREWLKPRIAA